MNNHLTYRYVSMHVIRMIYKPVFAETMAMSHHFKHVTTLKAIKKHQQATLYHTVANPNKLPDFRI